MLCCSECFSSVVVACFMVLAGSCFFFFKKKTAYERRISDWSSDVCSSDLPFLAGGVFGFFAVWLRRWLSETPVFEAMHARKELADGLPLRLDRKSVVSGKSVSVRVDLGGRRIIKKKKNTDTKRTALHI